MADLIQAARFRRDRSGEPQSFADEDARVRLSPTAVAAFRQLAEIWRLNQQTAAALLAISDRSWVRMKSPDWTGVLNQDQLTRISALTGIYKGLHLLFADGLADRWPNLANTGGLFEGRTPIEAMVRGGIPRMLEVRRHVDALRGGL
ncbi:MAG: DUF2384 domain-containing protein [Caulobacterales bacterium 68-7]|nr:MAG: DUF2384 domain-containing protein [Caulobacterales bacterium 68-7]